MKEYSQDEIEHLITCPKEVFEPPRKDMKRVRGYRRNDMKLRSTDGDHEFAVFMRINDKFPENFSIGLMYFPIGERGSICLLRFNGPHGDFISEDDSPNTHFLHHIHKADSDNISAGLRGERGAVKTKDYGSYDEALENFLQTTNIMNRMDWFPDFREQRFHFGNQDDEK